MKTFSLLPVAALAGLVHAHTTMWSALINGVDQGPGNSAAGYIRSPPTNGPLKDITASSMTCNVNNAPTAKTIKVKSGDKVHCRHGHVDIQMIRSLTDCA